MTLLDAEPYDPSRDRRRRIKIAGVVVLVLLLAWIGWMYRNWPEERVVGHFFSSPAAERFRGGLRHLATRSRLEAASRKISNATRTTISLAIGAQAANGAHPDLQDLRLSSPPGGGSGVIVEVVVNNRAEHARIWVQKSDKTLSFSPD